MISTRSSKDSTEELVVGSWALEVDRILSPRAMLNLLHYTVLESPLGPLTIFGSGERLMGVEFGDGRASFEHEFVRRRLAGVVTEHPDPAGAVTALRAYFSGDLQALDWLPVDPIGTTFQRLVWNALRGVRAGHTASYADIANTIGAPKAVRAVGAANRANPIAIVVPCHRIIGSSGSLVGYGGGLERKRWLLEHEGVLLRM
jgi:methylated-DNA-[protein]-cysteine S-methyltransferase